MSFEVVGIGEVLWDLLPAGPQLGGAPANFAYHARQLGAKAQVITRVGNDERGLRVLRRFEEMGIDGGTVQPDAHLPTGTARVVLGGDGTPQFTIIEGVAWDCLALTNDALKAVQSANAVCFGTLAQRTRPAGLVIQQLVEATPMTALRVFDINLRPGHYNWEVIERSLDIANVLKMNDQELAILAPRLELTGTADQMISQLAERFEFELVALTRAERGSLLYRNGSWSELPGRKMNVADTIGAGDAFTAALVSGMLHQFSLVDIHRIAADIASFVCSQPGATPVLPAHLRAAFVPDCTSV
jgi:fructokinase